MEIKVLENNDILITIHNTYYLIIEDFIGGTMIKNYFVYTSAFHNDLESFLNSEESDRHFYNEYADLISALKDIQEEENC